MGHEIREMVCIEKNEVKQFGMLHVPKGNDGPFPVAIISHGFMGHRLGKKNLYVDLSKRLSAQGIASLRMDFIGCGESEGDIRSESVQSQKDQIAREVDFLSKDPRIDIKRLALVGNSLGAAVSGLSIPHLPNVQCLVVTGAIAKGELWLSEWEKGNPGKNAREEFFFDDETYREFKTMSPVDAVFRNSEFPALIIHGKDDDIVSKSHFELYKKRANSKSQTILLDDVGHYYGHGPQRKVYLEAAVDWILKHII